MRRIYSYLLAQFTSVFGSLFFTLFFITSIIFFIQIARITAVIQIDFIELGKLYLYLLPRVLIFTIPVTFFIALTVMLQKLSKENELIVLFALGFSPAKIARFFFLISSLLSIGLLINSLVLIPLARQLNTNFVDFKKSEARLNIKATEFGQKFSNWLVFINSSKDNLYQDIVMYEKNDKENKDRIISASKAVIENKNGSFSLDLKNGKAYEIVNGKMHQLDFEELSIYTQPKDDIREVDSIFDYWRDLATNVKKSKDFSLYVLLALFPLATVLFALSFGIVTHRYDKGMMYPYLASVILVYFALVTIFSKWYMIIVPSVFFGMFFISLIFYKYMISRRY